MPIPRMRGSKLRSRTVQWQGDHWYLGTVSTVDVHAHSGKLFPVVIVQNSWKGIRESCNCGDIWPRALGLARIEIQLPTWHQICSHSSCGLRGWMPYSLT